MKLKKPTASTILTVIGAIGVVATAVTAVQATPKAMKLLDEAEYAVNDSLTPMEAVKVIAPVYIPTALIGVATIGCIFGANILNHRVQANMASAYALLDRSYKEYKHKIAELYGKTADEQVKIEMAKEHYNEFEDDHPLDDDECLFYDMATSQYFISTLDKVMQKAVMDDGQEVYILDTPVENIYTLMDRYERF